MKTALKVLISFLLLVGIAFVSFTYLKNHDIAVLNPKGMVGLKERNLMYLSLALMMIVVIPVFILTFFVAIRYRASNTKATYKPDWDHNYKLELLWWGVPCIIVALLSILTWQSCHELDPYKPLEMDKKPIRIQVVALQWKWLFIYPDYNIATINYLQFPEKTPLNFEITADAPMNSFWIPKLGGQIYAMAGMSTKLHLVADETGSYNGLSSNISGRGFSKMTFKAEAVAEENFEQWVRTVQNSPNQLDDKTYQIIAEPSEANKRELYSLSQNSLYDDIVMKYMMPEQGKEK
jgi:cytochrome o ubiquinol oxidase subunit 2